MAVKPVVRTAVGVAHDLRAMVAAGRNGISTEEAVRTFGARESQLEPWLAEVLAAKQRASTKAEKATQ